MTSNNRQLIGSGSKLEPEIGFSRGVWVGNHVAIGGTAPIATDGSVASPGDICAQTRRCVETIVTALRGAGLSLSQVVGDVRPTTTFVEVSRFIDADWLVEIEADAIAHNCRTGLDTELSAW